MSQKDPTSTTIGDSEYTMYPLPPSVSMDLLTDVISVISPVVAPVLSAIFGSKNPEQQEALLDQEVNADMFSGAVTKLNSKELKSIRREMVKEFAKVTHVDGKPLERIVEHHFLGNVGDMLQWLAWGMKVQWGKSLSALRNVVPSQSADLKVAAAQE